jgi:hypothetical protein
VAQLFRRKFQRSNECPVSLSFEHSISASDTKDYVSSQFETLGRSGLCHAWWVLGFRRLRSCCDSTNW